LTLKKKNCRLGKCQTPHYDYILPAQWIIGSDDTFINMGKFNINVFCYWMKILKPTIELGVSGKQPIHFGNWLFLKNGFGFVCQCSQGFRLATVSLHMVKGLDFTNWVFDLFEQTSLS
jgi:hypothetical protein